MHNDKLLERIPLKVLLVFLQLKEEKKHKMIAEQNTREIFNMNASVYENIFCSANVCIAEA